MPRIIVTSLNVTLQGTNISPQKWHFEDDFPFPKAGYVNSLEGKLIVGIKVTTRSRVKTTSSQIWRVFFHPSKAEDNSEPMGSSRG